MPAVKLRDKVRELASFLHYLFVRFDEDRCPTVAAALSFIAIFSLVPATAVVLPLLSVFPHFGQAWLSIQDFVFENFVPETGTVILGHLRGFAARATGLSLIGVGALAVTLTMALGTIEQVFNRIWRVRVGRRLSSRLLMYWAMLTIGPLLLGAGFIATSYIVSLPMLHGAIGFFEAGGWWLRLLTWVTTLAAFFLLYFFVPNRRVSKKSALSAALAAALLFELAKKGFTIYLARVASYEAVFGALAGLPAFLLWVYISWVVTLLGAELACCLSNYQAGQRAKGAPGMILVYALRLASFFRSAQAEGRRVTLDELHRAQLGIPWEDGPALLDAFEEAGIVHRTATGDFAASWNMEELTVARLQQALDCPLPDPGGTWVRGDEARRLAEKVRCAREGVRETLDFPLRCLRPPDDEGVDGPRSVSSQPQDLDS